MRIFVKCLSVAGLISLGYVLGATGVLNPRMLRAQIAVGSKPSAEAEDKIRLALGSLRDAMDALAQDGRYKLATEGINTFAVTTGGVDAMDDLEKGRGVDPETFAALYAGQANKEVIDFLGHDDQGRLTYKNKIVRMYPVSRLKQLFQQRLEYAGQ